MENPEFEWDDEKAVSNFKKHDVSFDEGATIFNDPMIATILDPDHSKKEERYISPLVFPYKAGYWLSSTRKEKKESD